MDEKEYVEFTRTVDKEHELIKYGLGLCEEAGEVAGKLKRIWRDDDGEVTAKRRLQIMDELGDTLYYITRIADTLQVSMEVIRANNFAKLASRLERGVLHGEGDKR